MANGLDSTSPIDLAPLYLFDYGDGHELKVQVIRITSEAKKGDYPTLIIKRGESPPQYPDYDENTGEMSWDPHSHLH